MRSESVVRAQSKNNVAVWNDVGTLTTQWYSDIEVLGTRVSEQYFMARPIPTAHSIATETLTCVQVEDEKKQTRRIN